jgi:hypothetical protein
MQGDGSKRRFGSIPFLLTVLSLSGVGGYLYADLSAMRTTESWGPAMLGKSQTPASERLGFTWPPRVGKPFPDLELVSHSGAVRRLSEFKGKIILVEPVGMNCPACNAFAGAQEKGGYKGTRPQSGLPSIEELLPRFAQGITIDDERLVVVHLLLFDIDYGAPAAADARKWSEHFDLGGHGNIIVMAGDERFLGPESFKMIPGFFLVDQDFILRADSTGHHPQDDLFRKLLPMIPTLL